MSFGSLGVLNRLGDLGGPGVASAASGYTIGDADAQAVVDNMDTEPGDGLKELIDNFVAGTKTDSVWTKIDRFWFPAVHEQGASARLDWKSPATVGRRLTEVNTPSWTAYQGYTGDGSTSYLNTNFTPSTDGVNYTQNSACAGVWVRTVGPTSASRAYAGLNDGFTQQTAIIRRADGSSWQAVGPNDTTSINATTLSQSATGLLVANRSGASARQVYRNGSSEASDTQASVGLPAFDLYLLARNSSGTAGLFSDGQISAAFVAASLNATEQANLHTRLNTLITGVAGL
jgi:hypothetical protein